jgi:hypothetical protein
MDMRLIFAWQWLLAAGPLFAAPVEVTLNGGPKGREMGVVAFSLPADQNGGHFLEDSDGRKLPVQATGKRSAVFISPALGADETRTWRMKAGPAGEASSGNFRGQIEANALMFTRQDRPWLTYQMQPGNPPEGIADHFRHGAYLHPVYSPSGKLVTGDYRPDHPHQRGIFMAWTKTEFEGRAPDFWNMGKAKGGRYTGEVRFGRLHRQWSGPVQAGFVSTHVWLDHTSGEEKKVLTEQWEVTSYALVLGSSEAHVIDLVSTQTCTGEAPLKLPKYHYGGLGLRGNALWDPVDEVTMLTSTGADRFKGDGTKAHWVWMGGEVDGAVTGTTILIHPENFRSPQPLRLNPKNPQLCMAPSADGDWEIQPGKPLILRYRLVIRDGAPDAALFDRLLRDYATPPKVAVNPL